MTEKASVHIKLLEAGRKRELEHAIEFVELIKDEVASHFLLNFFAPAGFAKTVLLEQIWHRYEQAFPGSFVRVSSFGEEDGAFSLHDLLLHIIRELDHRLPKRVTSLPADYEQTADEIQLAKLIIDLVKGAMNYKKATLLLLDDYDALPSEDRHWFEWRILTELVKTRMVAVIMTSEFELRFAERIDLRMRLERYELQSLSAEAISRSFPEYKEVAPEIHEITGGLPASTEELMKLLELSDVDSAADFQSHKEELTRKFYRTYVSETVLGRMPPDLREPVSVLAPLRRFDIPVLKGLLPKLLPKLYQGFTTFGYHDLIERLGNHVQWRTQGGYALKNGLRMVLLGYLVAEKPRLYRKVNKACGVLYPQLLKKGYREHYLVEFLYHQLSLLRQKQLDPSKVQSKISEELLAHLNNESAAVLQEVDLDSLRNTLMQDEDLKDFVSEEVLRAIQNLIEERVSASRVIPLDAANLIA